MRTSTRLTALFIAALAVMFISPKISAQDMFIITAGQRLDAKIVQAIQLPNWCVLGTGAACGDAELRDHESYRQVVIVPAGYTVSDCDLFRSDFENIVDMFEHQGGGTFAVTRVRQILYYGMWLPGEGLGSASANFGAKVSRHPFRDRFLSLREKDVTNAIDLYGKNEPDLAPWGVVVLFNTNESGITANATPRIYVDKGYGIAKISRHDLGGAYVGIHELAHAALNFLDEYVEYGFEDMNIRLLDALTPLAMFDGSWGSWVEALSNFVGMYNIKISEIMAANGNDNVDVTRYPSRVATTRYSPNVYEYEGGMFFGRGTWHDRGNNIMNSHHVMRGSDDGFGLAHSGSQTEVVQNAFDDPKKAARPNDRIRNAGPLGPWGLSLGSSVKALMFDADKYHAFHSTTSYDAQVSWEERSLSVCKKWNIPYPCVRLERKTVQKNIKPEKRYLDLKTSSLGGMASFLQTVVCATGLSNIGSGTGTVDLCGMSAGQMASDLLPSIKFLMPYQEVKIPTDQMLTAYQWRFRTNNASFTSGWTGWASFYRTF